MDRILEMQTKFCLYMKKKSGCVLLVSLFLTIAAVLLALRLDFHADYMELMPDGWKSVSDIKSVQKDFRGFGQLIPIIETDNPEAAKKFAGDFAVKIEELPEVEYVEYKNPYAFFEKNKYLYLSTDDLDEVDERIEKYITDLKNDYIAIDFLEDDEKEAVNKPEFNDILDKYSSVAALNEYFVSSDNRFLAMIVQPVSASLNLKESKVLIDKIRAIGKSLNPSAYDPSIRVGYTGMMQKQIDRHAHIVRQIKKCSIIGVALIFGLLAFYFRNKYAVFITTITLIAGTAWAYGLTYIFLGHVNIITGFAISIIMGLAIDYHIHIINQYLILRRQGVSSGDTFEYVYSITNRANLIACLTTILATILLVVSRFKGFSELAIVAALGLVCNYLASNVLLPAMMPILDRQKLGV